MQIKALWGFRGDAPKLKSPSADVKAGDVFTDVDPEYGHALVGKGLVMQIHDGAAPQETKPAKPSELKAGEGDGVVDAASSDGATGAASTQTGDGEGSDGAGQTAVTATGDANTTVDAAAVSPATSEQGGVDERALLIQQLEAAGVEFDRRWGAARLAAALAEAQKKDPA
ncbi:hypothetical protein [Stenotrophomonas maltophilia]|uniref:hypothetical protein n=1 Tax=Stenotrophomonas maltophilia TaxID=40324 RepID=UPI001F3FD48C|nr:hypothetical protein [Stenotrophomonas maltophilia]